MELTTMKFMLAICGAVSARLFSGAAVMLTTQPAVAT